jgi:flavin reductase (DIM6/NTAB) family NADH-FMN oxidoreductase RutF
MKRIDILPDKLLLPPVSVWGEQWFLLASGNMETKDFNCMTVAWGGFGVMWGKPLAMVVVRPTRHTYGFMEKSDSFTLSAFGEEYRKALSWCGSHSGRDGDKVKASGLTPIPSRTVRSPGFDEARLIIECRKMYFDDMEPAHFLDPSIHETYAKKDYHRVYFGEILAVSGTPDWLKA